MNRIGSTVLVITVIVAAVSLVLFAWIVWREAVGTHSSVSPPTMTATSPVPKPTVVETTTVGVPELNQPATSTPTPATVDVSTDTSTWATYTDATSSWSVQYPDLGTWFAEENPDYPSYIPGAIEALHLGWEGVGDFDISIGTADSRGMTFSAWLLKYEGIDISPRALGVTTTTVNGVSGVLTGVETTTVNGMNGVIVFDPDVQGISAYLEHSAGGRTLIYGIDFTDYDPATPSPPDWWKSVLSTFRTLPGP
jgi:hypothetical protein